MTEIGFRIAELVDQFRRIGETQMRDLPIYNASLDVEAVGFQPIGGRWIGILITPWFMSALILPPAKTEMDINGFGSKTQEVLPSGTFAFVSGALEAVGAYQSLPLYSPMGAFESQDGVRRAAKSHLIALLTPPAEAQYTAATTSRSRRRFLFGGGSTDEARVRPPVRQ